jgi:hypothetical protein
MDKQTRVEIPSMYADGSEETITLPGGYSATIKIEFDHDSGAPWEDDDGRGIVSEWTDRDKAPGELVLATDRYKKRYYDFAGTMKIAKRDGWDAPPYKTGTKGEQAKRAVQADYEYLRAWCNDEWHYCGVIVTVYRNGVQIAEDALWRVETYADYYKEVAREMIEGAICQDRRHRAQEARKARREARERKYWEARDVETI